MVYILEPSLIPGTTRQRTTQVGAAPRWDPASPNYHEFMAGFSMNFWVVDDCFTNFTSI